MKSETLARNVSPKEHIHTQKGRKVRNWYRAYCPPAQKENKNNGKKDKMTERIEGLIQGYYSRSQHHRSSMVAFRLFVKSVVRLPSSSRCCCCSVQAVLGPFVLSHSRPSLSGLSFPKAVLCRVCVSVAVVQ
jgi:hypothetical protein